MLSLTLNVTVENKPVSFEIDTGASVTVFSESFYLEQFKSSTLLPYDVTLSSYTTEPIIPSSKLNVNIPYRNEEKIWTFMLLKMVLTHLWVEIRFGC